MSTFLRTLALTAAAVAAIACVPQGGGYPAYADSDRYDDGGYTRIDNRDNDGSNSCRRAYTGVCDEGRYGGTNKCNDGTDTADCRGYGSRDRDHGPNSCRRAYNGVCDEGRYGGTNRCTDGTDTADCTGGRGRGRRDNNGWPFD